MRRPFAVGAAVAGLCLAWVGHAGALPTPVSSSLDFSVEASVDRNNSPGASDTDSDSQGATTNPLAATASATDVFGGGSATARASGAATWVNPAQGLVLLSDIGWETVNASNGVVVPDLGSGWQYEFVADATGTFTLDWSIVAIFVAPSFEGFRFDFTGFSSQDLDANTSSSLTRPIIAGQTYNATIRNRGEEIVNGETFADMDGTFNFSMTTATAAVPAPATLVLLGVGLLAAVLVRRQAV